MIVENEDRRNNHLLKLHGNLSKQGYPKKVIEMGIDKAKSIPQEDLRQTKRLSDPTNTLPFITTC